jgi:hypothetical protein
MPPLLDPATLAQDLIEAVGDVECQADGETYKLSELLETGLMYEVIGKNMDRTFSAWLKTMRAEREPAASVKQTRTQELEK